MKLPMRLLAAGPAVAVAALLAAPAAQAYPGMYGPGWDFPSGLWTPGKQEMIERRQALRSWWYAPLTGTPGQAAARPFASSPWGDLRDRGASAVDRRVPYRAY
jgi:hypothetical protein